jgi:thiamine-phosphate pyrophosphorylase
MKKFIGKFHYLTQDLNYRSHLEQAILACEAGANWIQYRCFSKSDDEMLKELHQIAAVCDDWGTTLIVTEHYHLLSLADIQGVHIEDMDADLNIVRAQIGKDKTLGASANNLDQIIRHYKNGADYIGCGPFAHTDTKPNNAAHWGVLGYKNAIRDLQKIDIQIPLIAAGGIELLNVKDLLGTGIHGIAVSAAVNHSEDAITAFKNIYKAIY